MNKMIPIALGTVLAAPAAFAGGLSQPVAEPPVLAPVPMAVPAIDGNWGGGYAGVQLGYGKADADHTTTDWSPSGAIGGVHAGYRWDLGRAVLGAEVDYNKGSLKDDGVKFDDLARLKLQAGYDLGRTLVYVTAGPARAKVSGDGESASDNGWFAGLGLDYQLSDQWSVGGEALYNKFDNFDSTGVDVKATTVQVKASYHF